jgi:hypothetical protein
VVTPHQLGLSHNFHSKGGDFGSLQELFSLVTLYQLKVLHCCKQYKDIIDTFLTIASLLINLFCNLYHKSCFKNVYAKVFFWDDVIGTPCFVSLFQTDIVIYGYGSQLFIFIFTTLSRAKSHQRQSIAYYHFYLSTFSIEHISASQILVPVHSRFSDLTRLKQIERARFWDQVKWVVSPLFYPNPKIQPSDLPVQDKCTIKLVH